MLESLVRLIVDESRWLTASMIMALAAVTLLVQRYRRRSRPLTRHLVLAAMTLSFGVMIGTMAFGHLLAVSVKLGLGTIAGTLVRFYGIGLLLAVPAWLLTRHASRVPTTEAEGRTTQVLNAWLSLTLLGLGLHNLPLAAPGILNIAYARHTRPWVGWALAGLSLAVNLGLFAGAIVFMASGQSFEQFSGIE